MDDAPTSLDVVMVILLLCMVLFHNSKVACIYRTYHIISIAEVCEVRRIG